MQEWRQRTTQHFLLRLATSAPLLLSFGGRCCQLLMGPQSSGHLSDTHCYAICAMFHLSWQELLTEMEFVVGWGASDASGNDFRIINCSISKFRHLRETNSNLSPRCLWSRCAVLTCSAVQWPPNSTAFAITSGGKMGLGMGHIPWSFHVVGANMKFEYVWAVCF